MALNIITKIFGTKHERDQKRMWPIVAEINEHFESYKSLSDAELQAKTDAFKKRLADGETLTDILPEAYAAVKDACRRLVGTEYEVVGHTQTWDMVPFDVQLLGGIVLHEGKIAEMATGEGKTLVATLPLYLNALEGKGCHLVTVNDYLARRDAEWMGLVYKFLGLTVGCIQNAMPPSQRREQYACDITYGTNNEFGFDYLRDNMAIRKEDRVHRNFHYAIVDEVDSVLIDEARTPLIISGPVDHDAGGFDTMRPLVEQLVRKQRNMVAELVTEGEKLLKDDKEYEAGVKLLAVQRGLPKNKAFMKLLKEQGVQKIIQRVEVDYTRDKRLEDIDDPLFYAVDERESSIQLTERGLNSLSPTDKELFMLPDISEALGEIEADESLPPAEKAAKIEALYKIHGDRSQRLHNVQQLLRAFTLYEKDVEYVVQDGKVLIVDQFTGRLMPGRRYSDGLHQAIEAKENVTIEGETQTLATITLQNYFRMYAKLAGMTGTAETEATEFWDIYKLDVAVMPTNEPVRRKDFEDVIYRTRREKYNAIIQEITECHNAGQPVLVGTVSVEVSEVLSKLLQRAGIRHNVLNAKYHQQEAEIIRFAGEQGAVTIATNMAGRGTDIKLGAGVVRKGPTRDLDEGGLHILGTERHEARRIDRQLRGRAGRQGDPGSSRFYMSLEDDLMRLFGSDRIASIMDRLGLEEGEVIEHRMVTNAIERAQKRVELQNYAIRKHLLEYDDVMNQQRTVIYDRRLASLEGEDLREETLKLIGEVMDRKLDEFCPPNTYAEAWDLTGLNAALIQVFLIDFKPKPKEIPALDKEVLRDELKKRALDLYDAKERALGPEVMREIERFAALRVIDERWKEHLNAMDELKTGIGMRAYGQRDPLIEYKREGFEMFASLLDRIDQETVELAYKLQPVRPQQDEERLRRLQQRMRTMHEDSTGLATRVAAVQEAVAVGAEGEETRGVSRSGAMVKHAEPPRAGKTQPIVREAPKVGRNDPCPCGSGKKYKKCHGLNA
jgi:preprotein translocase subunit SecA